MLLKQEIRYPSDFEAKKAIIEVGKRMYNKGFVAANDGNISCKVAQNAVWATPTGVSKGYMTPDMLVKMDLTGKVLMGSYKPSSEMKMHLRVYQENPDVRAVTHAHPPVATSFAIAGISLDKAILPEAVIQLGSVPIAHYATPGSQEVPDSIAPYCKSHNAVLLANHGALSWGKDVFEAFFRLESIEYYATILMYTGSIIGKQNELSCGQVNDLLDIRKNLGIGSGGVPPCSLVAGNMRDVVTAVPTSQTTLIRVVEENEKQLQGVTALVRPGNAMSSENPGCGCGGAIIKSSEANTYKEQSKEEIIAEVVRRVTEQVTNNFKTLV